MVTPSQHEEVSDQLLTAKTCLTMFADDQMVVNSDAEGLGDGDNIFRHTNIRRRRRRVA